ncbi:Protein of uncharacterised function (DUF3170) [Mycobacteroides abscessus subsp. abscessus]|nr:Protein of uncharacterised function (DUF3170) [Mycobacteroides abscessus subsp. abscessus]
MIGKQCNDFLEMFFLKGVEHDDFIDPVKEFRAESLLKLFHYLAFHILIVLLSILDVKADIFIAFQRFCPDIGCHDQDCVAEVDCPAFRICQASILKNLKEDIEYIRMCFLNLIQKDN